MKRIPTWFGDPFLSWLKSETEKAWAIYAPTDYSEPGGVGGGDWQRGTKWGEPLTEAEIKKLEKKWKWKFPSDYHLFLSRLHTPDKKMLGYWYVDDSDEKKADSASTFWDWRTEAKQIKKALDDVKRGILFDIEHNGLWIEKWGKKPRGKRSIETAVDKLLKKAPKLIPVYGHCFILEEPIEEKHPVLSIVQSDIIVMGNDLREYLIEELSFLLGLKEDPAEHFDIRALSATDWEKLEVELEKITTEARPNWIRLEEDANERETAATETPDSIEPEKLDVTQIPFWGDLAAWDRGELESIE